MVYEVLHNLELQANQGAMPNLMAVLRNFLIADRKASQTRERVKPIL
jgi:hypothetical protein